MTGLTGDAGDTTLVRFKYREAWASAALAGRVCGGRLVDAAQQQVRDDLLKAMAAAATRKRNAQKSQVASCRSQLGLDDSDVEPVGVEADSQIAGIQDVAFNGQTFKVAKLGRQVYI